MHGLDARNLGSFTANCLRYDGRPNEEISTLFNCTIKAGIQHGGLPREIHRRCQELTSRQQL